ncbi:hypothetical protein quinque_013090 [Culex quinquefasciatus]
MRLIQHPTGRTQTPMNCYEIRQSWPLKKNSRMSKLLREVQPDDLDGHRARLPEARRLLSQSRREAQAPVSIKSHLDRHRARLPEVQRLFSQSRREAQAPVSIKSHLDRHRARLGFRRFNACSSQCASTKQAFYKFLQSKKLESYFNLLNSHKITTLEEFSSLDESDIDSFCTVLLDKVEFRKILKETKATSSEESDEFLAKLTQKRYYYQPSYKTVDGKRVAPSGKLVKRKGSALEKLSKKMKANEMTGKATGPIENLNGQAAARDWLVRGRTPKEMIIDQWKNCFELRKQDISTAASLNEILEMYPIIKHPIGGNLVWIKPC